MIECMPLKNITIAARLQFDRHDWFIAAEKRVRIVQDEVSFLGSKTPVLSKPDRRAAA